MTTSIGRLLRQRQRADAGKAGIGGMTTRIRLLESPAVTPRSFLAPAKKETNKEAGQDELRWRRDAATPVPAVDAVAREELAAARSWEPKNVLDVRRRSGERTADGRIERSAHRGQKDDSGDA
jgi:hypothetical protein